jgi:transcriptional regulator with XRE-family HTH domain
VSVAAFLTAKNQLQQGNGLESFGFGWQDHIDWTLNMAPRLGLSGLDLKRATAIRSALEQRLQTETVDAARILETLADIAPLSIEDKRYACRRIGKTLAATFVRTARQKMGWSQREMSLAVGLKNGYVPQSESTSVESKVPIDYLVHVALVTGLPLYVGAPSASTDALVLRVRELEQEMKQLRSRLEAETELNNSLFSKFGRRSAAKKRGPQPGG